MRRDHDRGQERATSDGLELQRDVEAEGEWNLSVDARRTGVAVSGGIVTLTGEVTSDPQKWNAGLTRTIRAGSTQPDPVQDHEKAPSESD